MHFQLSHHHPSSLLFSPHSLGPLINSNVKSAAHTHWSHDCWWVCHYETIPQSRKYMHWVMADTIVSFLKACFKCTTFLPLMYNACRHLYSVRLQIQTTTWAWTHVVELNFFAGQHFIIVFPWLKMPDLCCLGLYMSLCRSCRLRSVVGPAQPAGSEPSLEAPPTSN